MSVAVLFTIGAGCLAGAAWIEYRKAQRFAREMQERRDETIRKCDALYKQVQAKAQEDSRCHS